MMAWDDGREALIAALADFRPWNEQEEKDRALILHALRTNEDIFTRQNTMAHMTASAWVLNPAHDRVLMAWHNIYHSWILFFKLSTFLSFSLQRKTLK